MKAHRSALADKMLQNPETARQLVPGHEGKVIHTREGTFHMKMVRRVRPEPSSTFSAVCFAAMCMICLAYVWVCKLFGKEVEFL